MGSVKRGAHFALDRVGRLLPLEADEVGAIIDSMLDDADVLAVVLRARNGDVAVQVLKSPDAAEVDALESAARAYRRALEGF